MNSFTFKTAMPLKRIFQVWLAPPCTISTTGRRSSPVPACQRKRQARLASGSTASLEPSLQKHKRQSVLTQQACGSILPPLAIVPYMSIFSVICVMYYRCKLYNDIESWDFNRRDVQLFCGIEYPRCALWSRWCKEMRCTASCRKLHNISRRVFYFTVGPGSRNGPLRVLAEFMEGQNTVKGRGST